MHASLERLRKRRAEQGDEGGFTLIELLIVIVILGILAAIVVFAVQNLTSSSSQASCGSDYKTVEIALEAYKAQMGSYPAKSTETPLPPATATSGPLPGGTDIYTGANAAASDGPLLVSSTITGTPTVNLVSPSSPSNQVGPWLKDVPANANHYTIEASNDGTGSISVLNGSGIQQGGLNDPTACNSVS